MKNKYTPPIAPNTYRTGNLIKISDPKSSNFFIKSNNSKDKLIEVFYDGHIIKNATACDRILICDTNENVSTIELKGSDLRHAMVQIETTLIRENLKVNSKKKTAVIVYSHSPSNMNSSKQNFSDKMRKNFNAKVLFCKSGNTVNYNEIL